MRSRLKVRFTSDPSVGYYDNFINQEVRNIAFNVDIDNADVARKTKGAFRKKGPSNTYLHRPEILIHDIDTNGNSSGSPKIVSEDGMDYLAAVNKGYVSGKPRGHPFHPDHHYNTSIVVKGGRVPKGHMPSRWNRLLPESVLSGGHGANKG